MVHDDAGVARSRRALKVALGVDNLGSGLFLPLAVVYTTTAVGVPLALAGVLITAGSLVGLLVPPLAGRLVDRRGPRGVVVGSQVLQVAGMAAYLLAQGPVGVLVAAALVAAGTQTFYSSVFALVADLAPAGPKDHAYAAVEVVRSAAFGTGALVGAGLLAVLDADAGVLRVLVAVNAASFAVSGAVLVALVRPVRHRPAPVPGAGGAGSVLRDRPYLALIAVVALLGLPADFLLVGLAVYVQALDPAATWAVGASVALLTASALLNVVVLRVTRRWARTTSLAVGGWLLAGWAALVVVAVRLPTGWVGPWVLGTAVVLAAGSVVAGTRVNALAEAAAPPGSRGRHLAAFQYAFTAAGLLAPLLVSTAAVGLWVPWVLVGAAAALGAALVPVVGRHLPPSAVRP